MVNVLITTVVLLIMTRYINKKLSLSLSPVLVWICFLAGCFYSLYYLAIQKPKIITFYYNQNVSISGTVTDVQQRWSTNRAIVNVKKIILRVEFLRLFIYICAMSDLRNFIVKRKYDLLSICSIILMISVNVFFAIPAILFLVIDVSKPKH
jgi:hypothetical protein